MSRTRSVLMTFGAAVLLFLTLGAWSLASPVGSSPDDDFHLASIWCGQGERAGYCEFDKATQSYSVPLEAVSSPCFVGHANSSASCQSQRISEFGLTLVPTERLNLGQYPPGYYFFASTFAGENVALTTVLIRLANAALYSILIAFTWWFLPKKLRFCLVGSAAMTFIPLSAFFIASTNPSSWAIISGTILFPAALGYFSTSGFRQVLLGAIACIAMSLGLLSRGDSAAYGALALLAAAILSFRPGKRYWRVSLLPLALMLAGATMFLTSGQTALALNGDMGAAGDAASEDPIPTSKFVLSILNILTLPKLLGGTFGLDWGLGWLDTAVPSLVPAIGIFLFAGATFMGLKNLSWRRGLALLLACTAVVVVPVYILVQAGAIVGSHVQPRYILPLVILLLAVAIAPSADASGRLVGGVTFTRLQLGILAVGLALTQSLSLFSNLRRYVTSNSYFLDTETEWWWPNMISPFNVLSVGTVAFASLMIYMAWYFQKSDSFQNSETEPDRELAKKRQWTSASLPTSSLRSGEEVL